MDLGHFRGYSTHMARHFESLRDILSHDYDTVIDVRSPSEFAEDHIPGAINLPALSDAERAEVGTIYVQSSAFRAKKIGAAMVARNAATHLDGPLAQKDGAWRPLIYCWRGGQRSGSFASILSQIGWRAEVIEGGYRSYRRMVVAALHDAPLRHRLILLDGYTGTAKTDLLPPLTERGVQTLDLEGLAAHRGSIFGHRAIPQPSQKAFEGRVAAALATLDPNRPTVVEAESSKIGTCQIPPSLWAAMCQAPRIRVSASLEARAEYLVRAYDDLLATPEDLKATLGFLRRMQGREKVEHWQALVDAGNYRDLAAELMQTHYDPRYAKSRDRTEFELYGDVRAVDLTPEGLEDVADRVVRLTQL